MHWQIEVDDSVYSQRLEESIASLCDDNYEQLRAVHAFCNRDWFQKAWEISLPGKRPLEVYFSGDVLHWRKLHYINRMLQWMMRRVAGESRPYRKIVPNMINESMDGLRMPLKQMSLVTTGQSRTLADLLHDSITRSNIKTKLPEDLVYNLIGIASDRKTCGIVIKYDKHWTRVFKEAALMLLTAKGPDILSWRSDTDQRDLNLPSWVPDFRTKVGVTMHGRYSEDSPKPKVFNACTGLEFEFSVNGEADTLITQAVFVDTIFVTNNLYQDLTDDLDARAFSDVRVWLKEISSFIESAADQYPKVFRRYSRPKLQELSWRLPIADRLMGKQSFERAGFAARVQHEALMSESGDTQPTDLARPEIWKYKAALYVINKSLFVTKNGYLGVGSSQLQVNDEIHIIQGNHVPSVLRRAGTEETFFRSLGEAYVHGIMDGELMSDCEASFTRLQIR